MLTEANFPKTLVGLAGCTQKSALVKFLWLLLPGFYKKKPQKKQSVGEENIFSFLKCDSNYECSYSIHSL